MLRALRGPGSQGFVRLPTFLVFLGDDRGFLDAIPFACDGDDLGVVQQPINDGSGSGHVAGLPHSSSGLLLAMMVDRFS